MAYNVEKLMKEHGDKIKPADKAPLEAAVAKTREVAKTDNLDAIKAAVSELEQASHALSKAMYEASQAGAAPGGGAAPAGDGKKPGEDEVVDAEFEVKE
jgi:molecular chaperone DnaK